MSLILHLVACHALQVPSDNPFVRVVHSLLWSVFEEMFWRLPLSCTPLGDRALVLPTHAAGMHAAGTHAAGPRWDSPVQAVRSVLLSYCRPAAG